MNAFELAFGKADPKLASYFMKTPLERMIDSMKAETGLGFEEFCQEFQISTTYSTTKKYSPKCVITDKNTKRVLIEEVKLISLTLRDFFNFTVGGIDYEDVEDWGVIAGDNLFMAFQNFHKWLDSRALPNVLKHVYVNNSVLNCAHITLTEE